MFRILGISLLFVTLFISACSQRTIVGSGKVIQETRQVGEFEQVVVCCGMELLFSQGEGPFLQIEAEDNLLPEIVSEVNEGTLHISFKDPDLDKYMPTEPVRIEAAAETIRGLRVSGGGQIETDALSSDDLVITLSGGSDGSIRSIAADSLQLEVSGGGNIDLGHADAKEMILNFSGGSNALITTAIAKKLDGSASGGGEIVAQNLQAEEFQLELTGGSRARVAEIDGETLELIIGGGGNANLAGNLTEQEIQLTGGSSYLGPDLLSTVTLVQGNGDAVIWVTERLDVQLRGNARVEYFGNPTVIQRLGGGSVLVPLGER